MEINQLYHGDCLELMKDIDDKSIDMILCDLPYGTTACKWDSIIPFEPLWEQYNRIIKDGGAIVLTASQPFTSALIMSNINKFKYCWYWNKTVCGNPLIAKYRPLGIFEDICVFGKGKINYNPIMQDAKLENIRPVGKSKKKTDLLSGIKSGEFKPSENYNPQKRYPKNEIVISSREKECNPLNRLHPTQKPVALFEYLIKTYTNEGDLVLDNCAGSGTTGIACLNTNRNYILMEKEQIYFDVAKKRIEELICTK